MLKVLLLKPQPRHQQLLQPDEVTAFNSHMIKNKLITNSDQSELVSSGAQPQVITLINGAAADTIETTWRLLAPGGLLIVHHG